MVDGVVKIDIFIGRYLHYLILQLSEGRFINNYLRFHRFQILAYQEIYRMKTTM